MDPVMANKTIERIDAELEILYEQAHTYAGLYLEDPTVGHIRNTLKLILDTITQKRQDRAKALESQSDKNNEH